MRIVRSGLAITALLAACGEEAEAPPRAGLGQVVISEIASSNPGGGPGAARDEYGEWDDWIELHNVTDRDLDLSGAHLSDFRHNPRRWQIPEEGGPKLIPARGYLLLFADGEVHQGWRHLPFRLDRDGEDVALATAEGEVIDEVSFPAMKTGDSYARLASAFVVCETPTPGAANRCTPRQPPPRTEYAAYDWPQPWPAAPAGPVVISELDPTGSAAPDRVPWVELENRGAEAIALAELTLRVARIAPPAALPGPRSGTPVPLTGSLAPGQRVVVPVPSLDPRGAVVVLAGPGGDILWDRAVFEAMEPDTVLALPTDGSGLRHTCDLASASPGEANPPCLPPPPRGAAPRFLRTLSSQADLEALAEGEGELTADARAVKLVIDRAAGNTVYFMDSARWPLHFDFVWEVLERNPPFDLCDPEQKEAHGREWGRFSAANYATVEARRYLLATVIHYRDSDLYTVELAAGDRISPALLEELFFRVASSVWGGERLFFRPMTQRFEAMARELEGKLPIVPADEPFEGTTFQPLNPGVGYGLLVRVEEGGEDAAPLSYQTIALYDRLPNDVPPVSGTITAELQTPLAHVNVLAQNRGTPNMALRGAASDPRIEPLLGRLVRLEVSPGGFELRVASSTEAEAFWREQRESRPPLVPRRDLSRRELVSLDAASLDDLPVIGAKAAQYAELLSVDWRRYSGVGACASVGVEAQLPMPRPAFAVPFARFVEHLERNGLDRVLEQLLADPEFQRNPAVRRDALAELRRRIRAAPVDPELVRALEALLQQHFGRARVRFRSSTNVEDLPGFNGAGLYDSRSAQLGSDGRKVEDALRRVWASVYSFRGFEERLLFSVDEREVAMGILIHRGFPGEEVNGVAITANVLNPASHGYYINAQVGEIPVVGPEGGELPEQLIYKAFVPPEVVILARSSVTGGAPVLQAAELSRLACVLRAAHGHLRARYEAQIPGDFAIDVEFKVDGPERQVSIKQARPWVPAKVESPSSCR